MNFVFVVIFDIFCLSEIMPFWKSAKFTGIKNASVDKLAFLGYYYEITFNYCAGAGAGVAGCTAGAAVLAAGLAGAAGISDSSINGASPE